MLARKCLDVLVIQNEWQKYRLEDLVPVAFSSQNSTQQRSDHVVGMLASDMPIPDFNVSQSQWH